MRHTILAALLVAAAPAAIAAPVPKDQLLVPPKDAAHYVIVSTAGKHGDEYMWTLPDGSIAFRQSLLLRGLIFEVDETIKLGADKMPSDVVIRGVTPSGDAGEEFHVHGHEASWTSPVDKGSALYGNPAYYVPQGGTFLSGAPQVERLLAVGRAGMALLPSGKASLEKITQLEVDGPQGKKTAELQLLRGTTQTPQPIWTSDGKFFGALVGLGLLPAGYEGNMDKMQAAQDAALAALAPATAAKFLTAEAKRPVLFKGVQIYDADGEKFVVNQNVLVADGKIVSVGAAPASLPANTRVIAGAGKTLVPGLWDSHMHVSDDFGTVSELALGVTSCRNPGGPLELEVSQRERRAKGTLLAPECFSSVIVDQKGPLVAQGSIAVGSLDETLAAVRKIHDAGLTGVKFYTSMNPAWIPPAAKLAHELGLHVHGHIPAGMRTLDAINAGYDEITHIYFATMQAMPDEIVAKSNTTARMTGPGRYFKDVDLDAEPMRAVIKTMAEKKIALDPTLVVVEGVLLANAGTVQPAYTAYVGTLPPATERGFKSGAIPYPEGMTRADAEASFKKMGQYVNKLRAAGVPIVAGTDGYGMEIVRELELYVAGGMTPAQALSTATIVAARNVKADKRTGSIAAGKEADLVLVDGDPSKRIGDLRHVDQVMSDGVLMDGDALRAEAGFNGKPK
ncbi:amidohydrolase family protein [Sphingomonas sp. SM33]|uniref:Amidohydrolase family protein n=1 Tax=Sphingomonas telluris TaxID=2907998 RepID=A0ABS9VL87_9SPHN|nr:amidohydrolase family protein [Sphingomonas telluris]